MWLIDHLVIRPIWKNFIESDCNWLMIECDYYYFWMKFFNFNFILLVNSSKSIVKSPLCSVECTSITTHFTHTHTHTCEDVRVLCVIHMYLGVLLFLRSTCTRWNLNAFARTKAVNWAQVSPNAFIFPHRCVVIQSIPYRAKSHNNNSSKKQ